MVSRLGSFAAAAVAASGSSIGQMRMEASISLPGVTLTDHGFERRDIVAPSGRMAVYEAGEGDPMVFVHGIGGGASSWTWAFVAPSFTSTHRVIVPDLVGWGSSEHPARFILFDDYVSSLEALLDTICKPAVIVAQSLACGFAMALAERRPDLVSRMMLVVPSGGKDFGVDSFGPLARTTITPFAKLPVVAFAFYKALFHRTAFIRGWFRQQGFFDPAMVTPEIVDAFLFSARQPNAAYSALPFATGLLRYDLSPYLQRLQIPAAILWGAQETQVGLHVGRRLSALRSDLPFTLIDHSKACPELEQPRAVVDVIRTFVNVEPASSDS